MICCLDIRNRNVRAEIKGEINSQRVWVLINKVGAAVCLSSYSELGCIYFLKTLNGMSSLPSEADITAIYKPGKDNFFFFMNTH